MKARKFDAVPDQLTRFVNAGGKVVQGLQRRRAAEALLWREGAAVEGEDPSSFIRTQETPPTPEPTKPLAASKTVWTGGGVAAVGLIQGASQIQAIAAPQAAHHEWLQRLVGFCALLIVLGGIAVATFKWLDQKAACR